MAEDTDRDRNKELPCLNPKLEAKSDMTLLTPGPSGVPSGRCESNSRLARKTKIFK